MHSRTNRGKYARIFTAVCAALLASAPLTLTAQHVANTRVNTPNIPQVAKTAGVFSTLLAAVNAAGLTETLMGRGPLTVFAPTDDAFKRLPAGTVESLLKPENREQLVTLLTYHVVAGRVTAAQARTVRNAETVAGRSVRISESNGDLRINDATVRIADVPASNGIIHVIDRVLMPPTTERASVRGDDAPMSVSSSTITALIDYAIDRGAPLYNDGQPAATVAIYEVAINGVLALPGSGIDADTQRSLRTALRSGGDTNTRDRAVALRRALDEARRQVSGRSVSRSM
ncbi:MAG: fasciclin domain-containing protein [Gemmatimonadaceae bacterium]|nr:fasciclin domain-containing protein [Gemmatimonadaceae bacterium]